MLTHNNRYMPVEGVRTYAYDGDMLRIDVAGAKAPLFITPNLRVAQALPHLPEYQAHVETARYLRAEATEAEKHLWRQIRDDQVGVKFRRQHPVGPFILDFYAPEIRLAVEADGGYHEERDQKEYDEFRQRLIEEFGVAFVRMTNAEILCSDRVPQAVLEAIEARKGQYRFGIKWLAAELIQPGMELHAVGHAERRTVSAINRLHCSHVIYDLRVAEDASYVTEACTVQCSSIASTIP